jgi:hypothetical protein
MRVTTPPDLYLLWATNPVCPTSAGPQPTLVGQSHNLGANASTSLALGRKGAKQVGDPNLTARACPLINNGSLTLSKERTYSYMVLSISKSAHSLEPSSCLQRRCHTEVGFKRKVVTRRGRRNILIPWFKVDYMILK